MMKAGTGSGAVEGLALFPHPEQVFTRHAPNIAAAVPGGMSGALTPSASSSVSLP